MVTPDPDDSASFATPTPTYDPGDFSDLNATLAAAQAQTPEVIYIDGEAVEVDSQYAILAADSATLISYTKAVAGANLGKITGLIQFSVTAFSIVLAVTVLTYSLPITVMILKIIIRILTFIMKLFGVG